MIGGKILSVYLLLLYVQICRSQQSSVLLRLSVSGHRLAAEHVLLEHDTLDLLECFLHCLSEHSACKSLNYKARKHQRPSKNCQINNITRKESANPQNLVVDKNYDYYEVEGKEIQEQETVRINAKSCDELYMSGKRTTAVYTIDPDGEGSFDVRCDMTSTPGRGWIVFQRRLDGSENFDRIWSDYKNGFGNLTGEFWLGLDKIHRISASGQHTLKVDLETFENETAYEIYESFSVGNETGAYQMEFNNFAGTAGNSFGYQGMKFTTSDVENDIWPNGNCARHRHGAWWFDKCSYAHLNGEYLGGSHNQPWKGILWYTFKGEYYSYKSTEMKLGPDKV